MKEEGAVEFPFCILLVSWEKKNVSNEAPKDAHVECDKHMTKYVGKDVFHL